MAVRYKRGDKSPSNAQLFFFRYLRGKEVWVTSDRLKRSISDSLKANRSWIKTEKGRICAKRGWTAANRRNKQKMSDYWKKPEVRQRLKDQRNSNPEIIAKREARFKWLEERAAYRNSDEFKAILKERNRKNWLKRKSQGKTREYDRNKWKSNLQHRLGSNMRRLVHSALTRTMGVVKSARTFELIGCSPRALSVHLEAKFTADMSWENYGTFWEVDHVMPLALFDLRDPKQQRQAFYFENLQPLEVPENRKKSDKIDVDGKQISVRKIIPFKAA